MGTFMYILLAVEILQIGYYAYTYFAGSFYHCSFSCNGNLRATRSGMSMVLGSRFSFFPFKFAMWSQWLFMRRLYNVNRQQKR